MPRKLDPKEREERRVARVKAKMAAAEERARTRRLKSLHGFAKKMLDRYGGGLIREDVGGCIGVRWTTASRDGTRLTDKRFEEAAQAGVFVPLDGKPYLLVAAQLPA